MARKAAAVYAVDLPTKRYPAGAMRLSGTTVPGVGVMNASAIAATVTDPGMFDSGRDFAAWLGMTPRQNSWLDASENYGEDRYAIIGMAAHRLMFVAYAMRGEAIRIISARGAELYERRRYHEENT